jgi:HPt (histidine-containing phosphotransfer) domain-containing protein
MSDQPVVDTEALDRLREWGGDKLLNQMVRLFLENSSGRMDQIRAGVSGSDPAEAERGSHSLKSSAANVGLGDVRRFASEIEAAAQGGDIGAVAELLPGLEEAYAAACAALASIVEGAPE